METQELLTRVYDLEAQLNGLMIYIAAKEAGITLDVSESKTKEFFKENVVRNWDTRLRSFPSDQKPRALAADGYWDALAASKIPDIIQRLQDHFGK